MDSGRIYRPSLFTEALRQGEILSDLKQLKPVSSSPEDNQNSTIRIREVIHPYCIVVSQDCDLDWDFRAREAHAGVSQEGKILNSILLCETDLAETVRYDESRVKGRKDWDKISRNSINDRFHFFEKVIPKLDFQREGIPELTSDFKRVFAVDAAYLYYQIMSNQVKRRAILVSPYLEHFSSRFHYYHGRIALPFQYQSQ